MNPKYKKSVEKRLETLNLTDMKVPNSQKIFMGTHVPTDISAFGELSELTDTYFEWCWTQIARLGPAPHNAVEIALMTNIDAFQIACYINTYGSEWSTVLFEKRRTLKKARGQFTAIKVGAAYWTACQLEDYAKRALAKTQNQIRAKRWMRDPHREPIFDMLVIAIGRMVENYIPVCMFLHGDKMPTMYRPQVPFKGYDLGEAEQTIQVKSSSLQFAFM